MELGSLRNMRLWVFSPIARKVEVVAKMAAAFSLTGPGSLMLVWGEHTALHGRPATIGFAWEQRPAPDALAAMCALPSLHMYS